MTGQPPFMTRTLSVVSRLVKSALGSEAISAARGGLEQDVVGRRFPLNGLDLIGEVTAAALAYCQTSSLVAFSRWAKTR
jgi:hypothetical protein